MLSSASQQVECEAFLSFVVIMTGIVLPIVLLLATEPRQSLAEWERGLLGGSGSRLWDNGDEQSSKESSGSGSGSGSSSGASGGGGLCDRWNHRAQAAIGNAAAAVEGAIRRLCRRSWLASGPMEEPEPRTHLRDAINWIGWDRLIFATDYPHWDYDDPATSLPLKISEAEREAFFIGNARNVYRGV